MKRLLLGLPIFLVAFFTGYVSAPEFRTTLKDESPPATIERGSQLDPNSASIHPSPKDVDFVPEFRDLADFDEDSPKLKTKLVDVSGVGNNYRRDEVIARTGETWLGLFWNRERLEFRNTKVTVKSEDRPNNGYENSVTFRFSQNEVPVFLVSGSHDIKEGGIITLESSIDSVTEPPYPINIELIQGFRREYVLNGEKYVLRVTAGVQRDGGKVNVLVLESAGQSQIISFNYFYKDNNTLYNSIGDLLWIGDMDRDGRLDLYFSDYGFEKGGFGSSLYLSSPAEKGTLLKLVAAFGTSGC